MPNVEERTKQKCFKIPENLAMEFEIQAKRSRILERDLIIRYIEEGLKKDRNQTTLD